MKTLVVVGTQWGDEGKGKITDYLAQQADVVVRYQGGNNAGHTIVFNNNKYALHLIPSGIFNPNITNIMANGMVINVGALIEELDKLKLKRFNLKISDRAHVVMPYHIDLDKAKERVLKTPVGTTHKGIGPAYTDKAARIGIRMGDLINPKLLKEKLKQVLKFKNRELRSYQMPAYKVDDLFNEYTKYGERLKSYITDTSILLNELIEKNKKVLFEGAQGTLLCLDHGTYPFVTSSSPTAASVPINTGIAPWLVNASIGVTKAYSTRVGGGAFPTELDGDIAHYIREKGNEYGTTTGRPRRVGYLDLVVLKHAKRVGGLKYLAVTLLDVLSGIDELKVCVGYLLDGKEIDYIPANIKDYERVEPIYATLQGWHEDITKVRAYSQLPIQTQNYIKFIEDFLDIKVSVFSIGPDREQTVTRIDLF